MNEETKIWEDPIVAEVRAIREAHARQFNYDLTAIVEDLMQKQRQREAEGVRFVTFPPPGERTQNPSDTSQSNLDETV
ncbi:hypothetical protein IQ249_15335 [Lusitaniella coriacea LEGE 07157]|uniref:Uncharacterized protein n=1 Tax=Lusitaniella coriacea LEGE 07157 TaxID=945747 RepID=A0A8J7DZD9_9CYAN|nr:hypothetical protein [Lusitaniella coriacea]MBE9117273.1 hypothetical protein [Lusitaniella coriacea LEGE 07157]